MVSRIAVRHQRHSRAKKAAEASGEEDDRETASDKCPICLEKLAELIFVLPCTHQFCPQCIKSWECVSLMMEM